MDDEHAVSIVTLEHQSQLEDINDSLSVYAPWSMQVKYVVDTVAEDADAATRASIRPGVVRISPLNQNVIVAEVANINSGT